MMGSMSLGVIVRQRDLMTPSTSSGTLLVSWFLDVPKMRITGKVVDEVKAMVDDMGEVMGGEVMDGRYVREADDVDEGADVVLAKGPEVLPNRLDVVMGMVAPGGK
jgi:hypothetical protein